MMDIKILLTLVVISFALFATSTSTNIFAQNASDNINQAEEAAGPAMNETGEAGGNATQATNGHANQVGSDPSNVTEKIIEGIKGLIAGNGQN